MPSQYSTRRAFASTAAGIAAGVFASPRHAFASQDAGAVADAATPSAVLLPMGYVSARIRTVESLDARNQVNEQVVSQFVANVEALEGFQGYALGDVIDQPEQSLSILVLEESGQTDGFDAIAAEFVSGLEETVTTVDTVQWEGEVLVSSGLSTDGAHATPPAMAVAQPLTEGYIAMRVHARAPGTDPRETIPLADSTLLPIIYGLPGFRGYLWYPTDNGFVAISFYESEAAAEASNEVAGDFVAEFLADYTDGDPKIINANVVYANMPIFASAG